MARSSRGGEGRVNDDWIERRAWTGWGDPAAVVEHDPGAGAKLRAVAGRPAATAYRVPVAVGLIPDEDGGPLRVEVAGYDVGRLAQGAGPSSGPRAVCGLVDAGEDGEPRLRLWLDRRMSDGHSVTVAHQREAIT
jgi:hypothetical protein